MQSQSGYFCKLDQPPLRSVQESEVPIQTMSLELAGRMYAKAAPRLTRVWLCLKYHVFASVHIAFQTNFSGVGPR
jgi:hypothetical protein